MGNRCCGQDDKYERGKATPKDLIAMEIELDKLKKENRELALQTQTLEANLKKATTQLDEENAYKLQAKLGEGRGGETFFNKVMELLWPYLSKFISRTIVEKVEPAIKNALPSVLGAGFAFDPEHCHLGDTHAEFRQMKTVGVEQRKGCMNIRCTTWVNWDGNCSIYLRYAGIGVGISDCIISGHLTVELVHLFDRPPFFHGLRMYFLDKPKVTLESSGALLSVASFSTWGFVKRKLCDVVASQIANKMVVPNRVGVKFEKNAGGIFQIKDPPPDGVLWLTVWGATDLPAADTNIFSAASSDPYVIVEIGAESYRSPTVYRNLSPVFQDEKGNPWTIPLRVSSKNYQTVRLQVFDEDRYTADDFLGKLDVSSEEAIGWGDERQWKELADEEDHTGSSGQLHLSAHWHVLYKTVEQVYENTTALCQRDDNDATCAWFSLGISKATHVPRFQEGTQYWVTVTCEDAMPAWGEIPTQTSPLKRLRDEIETEGPQKNAGDALQKELQKRLEVAHKYSMDPEEIALMVDLPVDVVKKLLEVQNQPEAITAELLNATGMHREGEVEWNWCADFMIKQPEKTSITVDVFCKTPWSSEQKLDTFEFIASAGFAKNTGGGCGSTERMLDTGIRVSMQRRMFFTYDQTRDMQKMPLVLERWSTALAPRPQFLPEESDGGGASIRQGADDGSEEFFSDLDEQ